MSDLCDVVKTLQAMCKAVGTPRAVSISMLADSSEWDQLVAMTVDPKHYSNAETYFGDRQVTDFIRKLEGLPLKVDLHQKALETFQDCEKQCYKSNERLAPFLGVGSIYLADQESRIKSGFIARVRAEIRSILGALPPRLTGRLGPGSTFSDKGQKNTVPHKFSSDPSLTRSITPFLHFWDDMWASAHEDRGGVLDYVRGNRFTSVPKDSTKNRGICIEPSLNLWFQLSVGGIIRRQLKRNRGLCLETGQEYHQLIAATASKDGERGTLDLSNASDTVSYNLVKLLLPDEWFSLLDSLRSPFTFVNGKWVRLEKFSSMGNGFTFELETLIFFSIASACCGDEMVTCYGDDLIVPSDSFRDVATALEYFGFKVNQTKSFGDGPFRESCGGDFFKGTAVRPYYLKGIPREPQEWIAVANGLFRAGLSHVPHLDRFRVIRKARDVALSFVPVQLRRLRGPTHLGDIIIHDNEVAWTYKEEDCIRYFKCYVPVSTRRVPWRLFSPKVQLASILYGIGGDFRGVTPRDSVTGFRTRWVAFS